tara:strand:- start:2110 stop:2481 length:372 start_codon:yes stop_codon:yes gene_type:complete
MTETKTANIYIEDDIVYLIYKAKADVGVDEIEENLNVKTKMQQGKAMKTLVDVREVWQYSKEAREVVSSKRFKKITIAMAVVVGYSLPVKIIANFFMKINKPITPTKLFNNKETALKWLIDYK